MKRSEREVIQDWLENIFKTWEKTNDLEVTLFKFTPLKRGDANLVSGGEKVVTGGNGRNFAFSGEKRRPRPADDPGGGGTGGGWPAPPGQSCHLTPDT